MRAGWLSRKVEEYSKLPGYAGPDQNGAALRLDSNENLVIPRQFQAELLGAARKNSDVREYPLGGTQRLARSISRFLRVPPSMIGVGSGSDQILDLILANFASRRTRILTSDPTFGFFEARCRLYSVPMARIPFSGDMTLDASRFASRSKGADILYLDMPNNPTGFQFKKGDLKGIVEGFPGLVIIDEAYGEFGEYSAVPWTKKLDNLVVVRTFSKSFGLAGLRLGYLVADRAFAETFNRVIQYPYPVSTIAIEAGIASLGKAAQVRASAEAIRAERRRVIEGLRSHDAFEVFDSKANFVLFDARGAYKRVHTALAEQGISIRKLGRIGRHVGCLRVTIGAREANSRFLLAIRDLLR